MTWNYGRGIFVGGGSFLNLLDLLKYFLLRAVKFQIFLLKLRKKNENNIKN